MYRKLQQIQGRVGSKETGYTLFSSTEEKKPAAKEIIQITIKNTKLHINKGDFEGSFGTAEEAIQAFADNHQITYKSLGHGYGTLCVQGVEHSITPYGIDISMMLKFCGIDESTLTQRLEMY